MSPCSLNDKCTACVSASSLSHTAAVPAPPPAAFVANGGARANLAAADTAAATALAEDASSCVLRLLVATGAEAGGLGNSRRRRILDGDGVTAESDGVGGGAFVPCASICVGVGVGVGVGVRFTRTAGVAVTAIIASGACCSSSVCSFSIGSLRACKRGRCLPPPHSPGSFNESCRQELIKVSVH